MYSLFPSSSLQIVAYVDGWLHRHMPAVRRWQYDDNSGERSINLFHVHVFIETRPFSFTPREGYEYFPPHTAPIVSDSGADPAAVELQAVGDAPAVESEVSTAVSL
jgi:hypothetical protein